MIDIVTATDCTLCGVSMGERCRDITPRGLCQRQEEVMKARGDMPTAKANLADALAKAKNIMNTDEATPFERYSMRPIYNPGPISERSAIVTGLLDVAKSDTAPAEVRIAALLHLADIAMNRVT